MVTTHIKLLKIKHVINLTIEMKSTENIVSDNAYKQNKLKHLFLAKTYISHWEYIFLNILFLRNLKVEIRYE